METIKSYPLPRLIECLFHKKRISTSIIIFLLFTSSICIGQNPQQFKSTKEVEKFVNQFDIFNDHTFKILHSKKFYKFPLFRKLADSLNISMWDTTDFNNDGIQDLLVIGTADRDTKEYYFGNYYLVFTSDSIKGYESHSLNINFYDFYVENGKGQLVTNNIFPRISRSPSNNMIVIYRSFRKLLAPTPELQLVKKKLVFKFGKFIDLNPKINDDRVEMITLSQEFAWHTGYDIKITRDGMAFFHGSPNFLLGDSAQTAKRKLSNAEVNQLFGLLDYADLKSHKDKYSVNWTDDATFYTGLTYSSSETNCIKDYGTLASSTLVAIYKILDEIAKSEEWIDMKSEIDLKINCRISLEYIFQKE